jgi:hypothetical protein
VDGNPNDKPRCPTFSSKVAKQIIMRMKAVKANMDTTPGPCQVCVHVVWLCVWVLCVPACMRVLCVRCAAVCVIVCACLPLLACSCLVLSACCLHVCLPACRCVCGSLAC